MGRGLLCAPVRFGAGELRMPNDNFLLGTTRGCLGRRPFPLDQGCPFRHVAELESATVASQHPPAAAKQLNGGAAAEDPASLFAQLRGHEGGHSRVGMRGVFLHERRKRSVGEQRKVWANAATSANEFGPYQACTKCMPPRRTPPSFDVVPAGLPPPGSSGDPRRAAGCHAIRGGS